MAPLEPWEKVLVSEDFLNTTHGKIACTDCHKGSQSPDKETAHKGMVGDPSADPKGICSTIRWAVNGPHWMRAAPLRQSRRWKQWLAITAHPATPPVGSAT